MAQQAGFDGHDDGRRSPARTLVLALCAAVDDEHTAQVRQVEAIDALCRAYATVDSPGPVLPGHERLVAAGADGTPLIAEHLATELAPKLKRSIDSTAAWIAESTDLIHRHPLLWQACRAGRLPVWQARHLARTTTLAGLTADAAAWVDSQLAPSLGRVAFGRLKTKTAGLIIRADVALAMRKAEQAQRERYVRVRSNGDGTAFLCARTDAADALRLGSLLDQLADHLRYGGDTTGRDERRATALGLLADPTAALTLLDGPDADQPIRPACTLSPTYPTGAAHPIRPAAGVGTTSPDPERPVTPRRRRRRLRAELIVHLAPGEAVGRSDQLGPVLAGQVRDWLSNAQVIVRPVIDLNDNPAVDSYEIPDPIARIVRLRHPYDVFPYATRHSTGLDLDHTTPYQHDPHAPAGQTCPDNLGPLSRRPHRARTNAGWHLTQPTPGTFHWTSPLGFRYQVNHHGTTELPNGPPGRRPRRPSKPVDFLWTPPRR